jgi:hypothetical protein
MADISEKRHEQLTRMAGVRAYLAPHLYKELPKRFPELTAVELALVLGELSTDFLKIEMKED